VEGKEELSVICMKVMVTGKLRDELTKRGNAYDEK